MKSCPFCQSDNISIHSGPKVCYVKCLCCSAEGPTGTTCDEAVHEWNRATRKKKKHANTKKLA